MEQQAIVWTFLLPLLGVLALQILYGTIKTRWPETYTSVVSELDQQVRSNPLRTYVLFRGGPVFLTTLFVVVLVERVSGSPRISTIILVAGYLLISTFRAIYDVLRRPRSPQWLVLVVYHLAAGGVVVAASWLAMIFRGELQFLIPDERELVIAAWAGLFATLFSTAVRTVLTPRKLNMEDLVLSLKKDVGEKNWDLIGQCSQGNRDFRFLLQAIILAEAQQRPKWFRSLERLKGLVYPKGTYGVAQMAAPKPISDKESIMMLADKLADFSQYRDYSGYINKEGLKSVLFDHNPDVRHVDRIFQFMVELERKECVRE